MAAKFSLKAEKRRVFVGKTYQSQISYFFDPSSHPQFTHYNCWTTKNENPWKSFMEKYIW